MLRMETETGWWLIRHQDHARLAGEFAAAWGNEVVSQARAAGAGVARHLRAHDDGWAARDAHPSITREGKPAAFSTELVGKYSAFEEIDLADYLAVRDRAVRIVAGQDPYAGAARFDAYLQSAHGARGPLNDRSRGSGLAG